MEIVCIALQIYALIILARIILTWFPLDPEGSVAAIAGFLFVLTDPVLGPIRRAIPPVRIGAIALDLSAIIVLVGIQVLLAVLGC